MNRILEVDLRNRMAVVEPGVPNLQLDRALAGTGYHFAPDPSSQGASTLGGNVATNAGGPHTLRYGVTVNHLLGVEAVLGSGDVVQLGPAPDPAALDLAGVLCGSEGTLAVVTKIWIRLTPNPQDYRTLRAVFDTVDDAANTATRIIAAGIIPAAMELMDQGILGAVEEAFHFGFPPDAAAVLVIEVDGFSAPSAGLDQKQQQIVDILPRQPRPRGRRGRGRAAARVALEVPQVGRRRGGPLESQLPHPGRRGAADATAARPGPNHGNRPPPQGPHRQRRPCRRRQRASRSCCSTSATADEVARATAAGREVLLECIACGGSITAEHGVGIEKLALMDRLFAPPTSRPCGTCGTLWIPSGLLNPGKVLAGRRGT